MYRFRTKPTIVHARKLKSKMTCEDFENLTTGHRGDWIVEGINGLMTFHKHEDFVKIFQPEDFVAEQYMLGKKIDPVEET